ncbi:hypothetical protein CPB86DRAFT_814441 [Serendipita vermifera]|nr:hypothetical protein CPB86DRAFT_814441 [Serendipita vermifera]
MPHKTTDNVVHASRPEWDAIWGCSLGNADVLTELYPSHRRLAVSSVTPKQDILRCWTGSLSEWPRPGVPICTGRFTSGPSIWIRYQMVLPRRTSGHDMSNFTGNAVSPGRPHFLVPQDRIPLKIQRTTRNPFSTGRQFYPTSKTSAVQD